MAKVQSFPRIEKNISIPSLISLSVHQSRKRKLDIIYFPNTGLLTLIDHRKGSQYANERKSQYNIPKGLSSIAAIYKALKFQAFLKSCTWSPFVFEQWDKRPLTHPKIHGIHLALINRYWKTLKQVAQNDNKKE